MNYPKLPDDLERFFSGDYETARSRFRDLADELHATAFSHSVSSEQDLTIDVAVIGQSNKPAVVVSSGVHGVEGFFGSAIQLALMFQLKNDPDFLSNCPCQFVLIHAVNPFGFQNLRRCNEDNADLNRNFLTRPQTYKGSPEGYSGLDSFLNPKSPPRFDFFLPRALWKIVSVGMNKLSASIAKGQYDFPQGLFFGGSKPSKSYEVIKREMKNWFGDVDRIVLLDFHTGLGKHGTYAIFPCGTEDISWYTKHFHSIAQASLYDIEGDFATWFKHQKLAKSVRSVIVEFGTYHIVRVLSALRNENRLHHFSKNVSVDDAVKQELLESFCPTSTQWRQSSVSQGLLIVSQAVDAIAAECGDK